MSKVCPKHQTEMTAKELSGIMNYFCPECGRETMAAFMPPAHTASAPDLLAERDRLKEVNAELLAALKEARKRIAESIGDYDGILGRIEIAIAKAENIK